MNAKVRNLEDLERRLKDLAPVEIAVLQEARDVTICQQRYHHGAAAYFSLS